MKGTTWVTQKSRKLIQGVGINDILIPQFTKSKIYRTWVDMIRRTDGRDTRLLNTTHPYYKDCTLDPVWFRLSVFKEWIETFDNYERKVIDKDIIKFDNKYYSPDTCLMVRPVVNAWFKPEDRKRDRLPRGTAYVSGYLGRKNHRGGKPYRAQIHNLIIEGNHVVASKKRDHLGTFETPEEASFVFEKARKEQLHKLIDTETDPRVINALRNHMQWEVLHNTYW